MSYSLDLIVDTLSPQDAEAWDEIEKLRESFYDDQRERAPELVELHALLTRKYPCLSSYADGAEGLEICPWADGPMINNFAHDMGMLAVSFPRVEEVVPFIVKTANGLGITVADGQTGEIHRSKGRS